MTTQDVVWIYQLLAARGITVWVDGGFCVDFAIPDTHRR